MNYSKGYLSLKDGSQIYYESFGEGDPLLLLHGNSSDSSYFDSQVVDFKEHFRVIRFDFRDHGKSNNAQGQLNFSILVQDLKEVFELLKIEKADILAFSDGANLAIKFATTYPQAVNRLILNAPNLSFDGLRKLAQMTMKIWHGLTKHLPFMQKKHRIAGLLVEDLNVSEEDLRHIQSPTLLLVGQFDLIRLEHILLLSHLIKGSSVHVLIGLGHQASKKNPRYFNRQVLKFLQV